MESKTTNTTDTTDTTDIIAPRAGSKQAKFVGMLSRKRGVTIINASETLGWQAYTIRATLTGLKKRGYMIERKGRNSKDSIYYIRTDETQ